jgi:N-acetylmuramoyl-L-alanine amidase
MVKRAFFFFVMMMVLFAVPCTLAAQYTVKKVVIDAGHGGKDPGAIGSRSREKDITLAIALKVGGYIEKYIPDVEVIYTRKTDVFVPLHQRASIANENKADLFISIHCNATKSSSVNGTETFVMGLHRSDANLEVAKLENAAILKEENYADMYEGFDPAQDEDYITLTLFQDSFLEQSTKLAQEIQNQFRERVKRKDRGVFQAGFLVLYKVAMPGVLVETGFITNHGDESFLLTEDGQAYIASAIYRAFKEYKKDMERIDNKAISVKEYTPDLSSADLQQVQKQTVYFRVQFASYKNARHFNNKKFGDLPDIRNYFQDGMVKYTTGNTISYNEALTLLKDVRDRKKIKDAFVVAFVDEKRISIEEALKLTEK